MERQNIVHSRDKGIEQVTTGPLLWCSNVPWFWYLLRAQFLVYRIDLTQRQKIFVPILTRKSMLFVNEFADFIYILSKIEDP